MTIKILDILKFLEDTGLMYQFIGNDKLSIEGFCSLNQIRNNCITWIKNKEDYTNERFEHVHNILIVSNPIDMNNLDDRKKNFIFCEYPKGIFFSVLNQFFKQKEYESFISQASTILTKSIGKNVYIGHHCFIDKDVVIENNVIIKNCVSIEGKVKIGANTIIDSGAVIGSDGNGYFKNDKGLYKKVPDFGGIIIGEDVEVGANTCIVRGTLDNTIIGNNVKIDKLCHIAHNVHIKDNCCITAGTTICGSVLIEENSYIAPGVVVNSQLTLGSSSFVCIGSVVIHDVQPNKVVIGVPARTLRNNNV